MDESVRARSLPPIGDRMANPFWSRGTQEEFQVRQARPADLPIPNADDWSEAPSSREARSGQGQEGVSTIRGRSRSRNGRPNEAEGSFTTPQTNWQSASSGVNPEHHEGNGGGETRDVDGQPIQDSVERALEREVVEVLHVENVKLKEEIERMKQEQHRGNTVLLEELEAMRQEKRQRLELQQRIQKELLEQQAAREKRTPESWSRISGGSAGEAPPPPPPMTPKTQSVWRTPEEEELRCTPNGTTVPRGPPPGDSLIGIPPPPSWMMVGEKVNESVDMGDEDQRHFEVYGGDRAWTGHRALRDRASLTHDGLLGQDRAWHGGHLHGDRASLAHEGLLGQDRAWQGGHRCGDRAGVEHGAGADRDRAIGMG